MAYKTSSDEWKIDYTLNLVCDYTEVRHEQPWHMRKMVGTKFGALEPLSSVEEVGTGVLQTYLALLDGDHIGEATHYPGAICKHRHFWLITETTSSSHHMHTQGHPAELIVLFSFPVLIVIVNLLSLCKIRKESCNF